MQETDSSQDQVFEFSIRNFYNHLGDIYYYWQNYYSDREVMLLKTRRFRDPSGGYVFFGFDSEDRVNYILRGGSVIKVNETGDISGILIEETEDLREKTVFDIGVSRERGVKAKRVFSDPNSERFVIPYELDREGNWGYDKKYLNLLCLYFPFERRETLETVMYLEPSSLLREVFLTDEILSVIENDWDFDMPTGDDYFEFRDL